MKAAANTLGVLEELDYILSHKFLLQSFHGKKVHGVPLIVTLSLIGWEFESFIACFAIMLSPCYDIFIISHRCTTKPQRTKTTKISATPVWEDSV
jgi:hypothetical protein